MDSALCLPEHGCCISWDPPPGFFLHTLLVCVTLDWTRQKVYTTGTREALGVRHTHTHWSYCGMFAGTEMLNLKLEPKSVTSNVWLSLLCLLFQTFCALIGGGDCLKHYDHHPKIRGDVYGNTAFGVDVWLIFVFMSWSRAVPSTLCGSWLAL